MKTTLVLKDEDAVPKVGNFTMNTISTLKQSFEFEFDKGESKGRMNDWNNTFSTLLRHVIIRHVL